LSIWRTVIRSSISQRYSIRTTSASASSISRCPGTPSRAGTYAVAIGRTAEDPLAGAGLVELAAAEAFDHFRKVRRSYWPGLFPCYDVDDLPRTNNDLEQCFGSFRYHERRCSGRKVACPGTVVRGSVRLMAAAATRLRPVQVSDLVPTDLAAWRSLRESLERRRAVRVLGRRFCRDPAAYLRSLEEALIKATLPP
jgi:hypothetical protein